MRTSSVIILFYSLIYCVNCAKCDKKSLCTNFFSFTKYKNKQWKTYQKEKINDEYLYGNHCGNHEIPLFRAGDGKNGMPIKDMLDPYLTHLTEVRTLNQLLHVQIAIHKEAANYQRKVRHVPHKVDQRWFRHLLQALEILLEMQFIFISVYLNLIEKKFGV